MMFFICFLVLFVFCTVIIVRTVLRTIGAVLRLGRRPKRMPAMFPESVLRRCRRSGCQTTNPPHASFCRRCGMPLNVAAMAG